MNKHRGVKNFKCDLCGAAYIHSRDFVSSYIILNKKGFIPLQG